MVGFTPDLPEETVREIARTSKRAYRALEMRDYARIDLRVTPEGKPYVIEVNPNPYLAWGEDFAESAQEAGIDYEQLIDRILNIALKRANA
jgi:D-alanine-D-alanine ligase